MEGRRGRAKKAEKLKENRASLENQPRTGGGRGSRMFPFRKKKVRANAFRCESRKQNQEGRGKKRGWWETKKKI